MAQGSLAHDYHTQGPLRYVTHSDCHDIQFVPLRQDVGDTVDDHNPKDMELGSHWLGDYHPFKDGPTVSGVEWQGGYHPFKDGPSLASNYTSSPGASSGLISGPQFKFDLLGDHADLDAVHGHVQVGGAWEKCYADPSARSSGMSLQTIHEEPIEPVRPQSSCLFVDGPLGGFVHEPACLGTGDISAHHADALATGADYSLCSTSLTSRSSPFKVPFMLMCAPFQPLQLGFQINAASDNNLVSVDSGAILNDQRTSALSPSQDYSVMQDLGEKDQAGARFGTKKPRAKPLETLRVTTFNPNSWNSVKDQLRSLHGHVIMIQEMRQDKDQVMALSLQMKAKGF